MEHLFNDQFNVSTVFLKDVQGLQSRFLLVGLVHFLLLPFMILFMIIHFTLQNIQQFHSSKSYLGPRQWSPYALWKFREFNELKHVFEQRILQSYKPLNEYLHTFHIPYLAVGARCCVYLSGSLLAVLLIVSLIDEAVLLYIHVGDHNLLWYLGIFTAVYGASNSMIPDETVVVTREEQETLVQKVSAFTHFSKVEWQDRCHTTQVRDELVELFPYKVQLFFLEIMSVILTPIVLCFSLPQCSYDILHFIRDHSKYLDGVGAICDYSLMELDIYGDEDFGTVIDRGRVSDRDRPHDGKLEQSYMSFQQQHPTWAGNPTGRNLMNKINDYKLQVEDERQSMISSTLYQSMNLMRSHHAPPAPAPHGHGPLPAPLHSHAFSPNAPMNSDHRPQAAASAGAAMAQQDSVPSLDLFSEQESAPLSPLPSCGGDLPMFAQNSQSLAAASTFLFSAMGSGGGSALDNMPSVLRSVLRKENIDYENDFYWLTKVFPPSSPFLSTSPFPPLIVPCDSSNGIVSRTPFPPPLFSTPPWLPLLLLKGEVGGVGLQSIDLNLILLQATLTRQRCKRTQVQEPTLPRDLAIPTAPILRTTIRSITTPLLACRSLMKKISRWNMSSHSSLPFPSLSSPQWSPPLYSLS
jgi:hypothetical protein